MWPSWTGDLPAIIKGQSQPSPGLRGPPQLLAEARPPLCLPCSNALLHRKAQFPHSIAHLRNGHFLTSFWGDPPFLLCTHKVSKSNRTPNQTDGRLPYSLMYRCVMLGVKKAKPGTNCSASTDCLPDDQQGHWSQEGINHSACQAFVTNTEAMGGKTHTSQDVPNGMVGHPGALAKSPGCLQEPYLQLPSALRPGRLGPETITGSEISKVLTISCRAKNRWAPAYEKGPGEAGPPAGNGRSFTSQSR